MPTVPHNPSVRARQARIHPADVAAADLSARVQVTREGGRIMVTLTRKYRRVFGLGDDEAQYLIGLLGRMLSPVTTTTTTSTTGGLR